MKYFRKPVMRRTRKKRSIPEEQPNRKSVRMSKPSQRLIDAGLSTKEDNNLPNNVVQENVIQPYDDSNIRDQMKSTNEKIEQLQQMLTQFQQQFQAVNSVPSTSQTTGQGKVTAYNDSSPNSPVKQKSSKRVLQEEIVTAFDDSSPSSPVKQKSPRRNLQEFTTTQDATSQVMCSKDSILQPQIVDMMSQQSAQFQESQVSLSGQTSQNIVSEALRQILIPEDNSTKEGEQAVSSYLLAGAMIDPKVKNKIWAREYVNLSQFTANQDHSVSVSILDGGQPSISLKQNKASPPANFNSWLQLFLTYASVYLEKYPEEGSSIVTYIFRIMDFSKKYQGFGWRVYDERFRQIRSKVQLPWHVIRS